MDSESVNSWNISVVALLGNQSGVYLEDNIVKRCAEVCTIDRRMAGGFGVVDIFAFSAVELYSLNVRVVGLAHR